MAIVVIEKRDLWPYYGLNGVASFDPAFEVPDEQVSRWKAAELAFLEAQAEIARIYEAWNRGEITEIDQTRVVE